MLLTHKKSSRQPRAFLLALAAAFAIVILAATACERPPADATTPEGAVHIYLEALKAGDVDAAYAMLSAKLQTECKVDSLKTNRSPSQLRQQLEDASVVVRRVEITGTTATVEVSINSGGADVRPFGARSTGGFDNAYRLVMVAGIWQLSEPGWPVYWCGPGDPEKPRGVEPAATPAAATPAATTPPPPTATPTARALAP